jgi:predicted  nucleic acid-binding Zn-ribbon protein
MARDLVTRADLRRALALNAVTRPVNVLVPAAVAVAAAVIGAPWLLAIAVVCFVALVAFTFFDEREAERVGERVYARHRAELAGGRPLDEPPTVPPLAPAIAARLDAARAAQAEIDRAVDDADLPAADIREEVAELLATLTPIAVRADRVADYLASHPARDVERRIAALRREPAGADSARRRTIAALEDQLAAIGRLRGQHDGLLGEMDHVVASLEALHAEVVTLGAAEDEWSRRNVAGQVRALREGVQALSGGMEEAYAETRSAARPV